MFCGKSSPGRINFGRVEDLENPIVSQLLENLPDDWEVFVFPFDFQVHGIERVDFDFVVSERNPNPIIALPAVFDVFKVTHQGLQYQVKLVTV